MPCESAVTELYQDAVVGSSLAQGTTIIQCDLRKLDCQGALGTTATICGRQEPYPVALHELSTFHPPITYRFRVAQGAYRNAQNQRVDFTPEIKGVSTSQHMSHSVIRLACSLALLCGVSLRPLALRLSALFLIPMTKASINRWMEDMGTPLPTPDERLRQLLALAPATAWHLDGDSPLGTDHWVMVVKDAPDRSLITHAAAWEHGDEAAPCLQHVKDLGLKGTAAFADYSSSFTEALKAIGPQARFQADHCPTVQQSWGPLKKSLLLYRRQIKARGEAQQHEACSALAKKLWTLRWRLLTKPCNLSVEEKQAIAVLESEEEGFVHHCRHVIRQLVHIFVFVWLTTCASPSRRCRRCCASPRR
jgi:hypothetical protein